MKVGSDGRSRARVVRHRLTVVGIWLLLSLGWTPLSAGAQEITGSSTQSIINGDPVVEEEAWPWMVSLTANHPAPGRRAWGHACGASLIAPNRVLTAAHCVVGSKPSDIDVVIGRKDLANQNTGERIPIVGISMPPDVFRVGASKDVAILKLARNAQATPVGLATESDPAAWAPGTPATALGFGVFDNDLPRISQVLRQGNLSIISDRDCADQFVGGSEVYSSTWHFDRASMICAEDPSTPRDQSGCQWDSGGPLVVGSEATGYLQVGVFSWSGSSTGKVCDPDYPTVYSRVPALHSFITTPDAQLVFKPYNLSPLEVTGDYRVGQPLECSVAAGWSENPSRIEYEWMRVSEERIGQRDFTIPERIEGATDSTYRPVSEDSGKALRCSAKAFNGGGFHQAVSESTSKID